MIAPSILSADFGRLAEEVREADLAGGDVIHVDIMDGHFVPNLTIGPVVVQSIRAATDKPFDVHLMLTHPDQYVERFASAGADHITIHVESEGDTARTIESIRQLGCSAGLSLRPDTSMETLLPYLDLIDLVLVMTVEPGFGGQHFQAKMLPKMGEIRRAIDDSGRPIHLEVDGGINADTAGCVAKAGANLLVAGSSVFRAPAGMAAAIAGLRKAADGGTGGQSCP